MTHEEWLTEHGFVRDEYGEPVWTHTDYSIVLHPLNWSPDNPPEWTDRRPWHAEHLGLNANGDSPEEALRRLATTAHAVIDHAQMTIAAIREIMP